MGLNNETESELVLHELRAWALAGSTVPGHKRTGKDGHHGCNYKSLLSLNATELEARLAEGLAAEAWLIGDTGSFSD